MRQSGMTSPYAQSTPWLQECRCTKWHVNFFVEIPLLPKTNESWNKTSAVCQENVSPPTRPFPETASAKNKAVHRPNIALSKQSKVTDSEPLPG